MSGSPRSFRHGVHPAEHKATAHLPVDRLPVGAKVTRGQLIAEATAYVSTCLHSPVEGKVIAISPMRHPNGGMQDAIAIEADAFATQKMIDGPATDWQALSQRDFVSMVKQAGLVGLGGAAFPSHVKYAPPEGKNVRWLVLNGCECEPYLTCDHREMVERPEAVIRGALILAHHLDVEGVKIGVENNKTDAITALQRAAENAATIEVVPLQVKYPQGAEKMLIKAIFGWEVPAGKLPLDLEIVVNNVGTMGALADYFDRGMPLIERIVTVAGDGVERPGNLMVPLGTPVRDVLEYCGLSADTKQVVMGGPMMGMPLSSIDVPVLKGTSGLLAFTEAAIDHPKEYTCVRCGRCLDACANFLNPSRLARLARAGRYERAEAHYVMDCMECGACTYACPSGIPIVQLLRVAKSVVREQSKKKAAG